MDFGVQRTQRTTAVPPDGDFPVGVVLRSGTGDGRKFEIDAVNRRAIHTDAVLWDPEDEVVARRARVRGQSQTGASADAADGTRGDLPEATTVGPRFRAPHLSVSATGAENRSSEPSLVQRHNLHTAAARVHLSGGGDGLVQPVCTGLGGVGVLGHVLLPSGSGLGLTVGTTGYFQHRSRSAVHQRRFHQAAGELWHRYQHGRAWTSERQHFHRTFMADGEIRRGLSEGLLRRAGSGLEPEELFCFLQSPTSASSFGLPDTGDDILRESKKRVRRFRCTPGAIFFHEKPGIGTTKERNEGPVETDAPDGNPLTTRIPTEAWKAQNAFHSSHEARRRLYNRIQFFERQRSTLNTLSFGPKDGEHLKLRIYATQPRQGIHPRDDSHTKFRRS